MADVLDVQLKSLHPKELKKSTIRCWPIGDGKYGRSWKILNWSQIQALNNFKRVNRCRRRPRCVWQPTKLKRQFSGKDAVYYTSITVERKEQSKTKILPIFWNVSVTIWRKNDSFKPRRKWSSQTQINIRAFWAVAQGPVEL